MSKQPKNSSSEKTELHARNRHRQRYDFEQLVLSCPELSAFVGLNEYGIETIDFADPEAVKSLNKALLVFFYGINHWDIPKGFLCPPIPGRADYIHYVADLLASQNNGIVPGKQVRVLDIGVGANCIYPLIGKKEYDWSFVGSDIDQLAINSARKIVLNNGLQNDILIRKQSSSTHFFKGILEAGEFFDLTICNPPFHSSLAEAGRVSSRKLKNLGISTQRNAILNFGGQNAELFCEGGEEQFLYKMILESRQYAKDVFWFTSLVSQKKTLDILYPLLKKVSAVEVKTINMAQGQKVSRVLAWTFINEPEQKERIRARWNS